MESFPLGELMSIAKTLVEMTQDMREERFERRKLLIGALSGGATLVGGAMLAGCGGDSANPITGLNVDADILNFALNLEYLEAEYYLRATTGQGLDTADIGSNPGNVTGGSKVAFSTPAFRDYGTEIANDELHHVRFLRKALGSAAVARPVIDLKTSFDAAAQAAGLGATFDPFANEVNFLIGAFVFEDVGVTAYKGAAKSLTDKNVLEAAAGILGTEAYHAATVRTVLYQLGGTAQTAAQKISDLRDQADGGADKDQGIVLGGKANIVPTDANGIVFSRSTAEVLKIVYLGGTSQGGFFPNGLNGKIK